LSRPAPAVPADPVIKIRGAVTEAFDVSLATLAALPRQELSADFHCVAGWSATDLSWEGVRFETFYQGVIAPALAPGAVVTHLVFGGLDGWRSVVSIEDALADDVLIAERLNGQPLTGDHGAPARLVSPSQYGYVNTKHLSRIDVHTAEPKDAQVRNPLLRGHPRGRVWKEERHKFLPAWTVRPVYRSFIAPFIYLSAKGSDRARESQ
jgi:DMSO/TMAO reductase YedYZ molybdopterin-dependent catalytic subunit